MGACSSSKNRDAATTYNTKPTEIRRNNADLINILPVYDFIYDGNYAKYLKVRQNELSNMELQFGDIIEITNPTEYAHKIPVIIGINNEFIPCTSNQQTVVIPFSICSKLQNPIACYSKLMTAHDEYTWKFHLKNDDKYILHRFGGPLSNKYHNITLYFKYGKLQQFAVTFPGIGEKLFDTQSWNYTNKDIDLFYEIRTGPICNKKHHTNLIILEINSNDYNQMKSCVISFPSSKWEYIFTESNEYNNHYFRGYLIGPRDEQEKMKQMYESQFGKTKYWSHSVNNYSKQAQLLNLPYTMPGGY